MKPQLLPITKLGRCGVARCLIIAILLMVLVDPVSPARAHGLEGRATMDLVDTGAGTEAIDDEDNREEPVLQPLTGRLESTAHPPTWIKGKVFSNEQMYMYSFYQIHPFKKEFRWHIPSFKRTIIRMRPSVVRYWKGWKPDGPCEVICEPMGEKGQFKFHHARPDGPHGYLERVGETNSGFPRYRFWFDDDEHNTSQQPVESTEYTESESVPPKASTKSQESRP